MLSACVWDGAELVQVAQAGWEYYASGVVISATRLKRAEQKKVAPI